MKNNWIQHFECFRRCRRNRQICKLWRCKWKKWTRKKRPVWFVSMLVGYWIFENKFAHMTAPTVFCGLVVTTAARCRIGKCLRYEARSLPTGRDRRAMQSLATTGDSYISSPATTYRWLNFHSILLPNKGMKIKWAHLDKWHQWIRKCENKILLLLPKCFMLTSEFCRFKVCKKYSSVWTEWVPNFCLNESFNCCCKNCNIERT